MTVTDDCRSGAAPVAATPLLIRFGRIGDMVLQLPLLNLLHRRFGQPPRLLTSGDWPARLFASCSDVGELWQLRTRHVPPLLSPERWRAILRLHRHRGPIYVSEDSPRQLPKIRFMLALARVDPTRCLFVDQLPAREGEHWVDQLLRLGRMTRPRSSTSPPPLPANRCVRRC
jgi:heptosyltransferase-2/heptosyltransferase-3